MARENHYAALGVPRDASQEDIKRAYRRLALESHPDRFPDDPEAEARFRRVAQAYTVLGDPAQRARYDASLLRPGAGLDLAGPPTTATALDMLNNVFGDLFGSRRKERRKGRDIRYTLTVDLEAAVLGSTERIEFETYGQCTTCKGSGTRAAGRPPKTCPVCEGKGEVRDGGIFAPWTRCGRCDGAGLVQQDPCADCGGRGSRRNKRAFDVKLPAGTQPGAERIIEGQGEPGRFGGAPGNLRVTVNVRGHAFLTRKGEDIHCELPVSITEAALGGKVAVPTVDGWVDLQIPTGTRTGSKLRLRGKGVPRGRGQRGDQLVTVVVETPLHLPTAMTELLQRLERLVNEVPGTLPRRDALREAARLAAQQGDGEPPSDAAHEAGD